MRLEVVEAGAAQLPAVENLLQLYVYDYTDFMDWDVEADGRYSLPDLDGQLTIPGRSVFLLRGDDALAGFAIVDRPQERQADYDVDMREFFVMRRFRRQGAGAWFARQLFERSPGRWRVEQLPANAAAIVFWRKVIGRYTGGNYRETTNAHGDNVQYFDNSERFVRDEAADGPDQVTPQASARTDVAGVQAIFMRYVEARNTLLDELKLKRQSNRDPLAEFSEWLVAALVGGTLAESPVQPGWDVRTPDDERIQVKYLANSADSWVNEHPIQVTELMDSYALVIFEALLPQAAIVFPARNLAAVGARLGKRHGNLDSSLLFTRANYLDIRRNVSAFKALGVKLYLSPRWNPE